MSNRCLVIVSCVVTAVSLVNTAVSILLFAFAYDLAVFMGTDHPCAAGKRIDTLAVHFVVFVRPFINISALKASDTLTVALSVYKFTLNTLTVSFAFAVFPFTLVAGTTCIGHDTIAVSHIIFPFTLVMGSIVPVYYAIAFP